MRNLFSAALFVALATSMATGENIGKQTEHLTAQIAGGEVHYYVALPKNYDPARKYTLILSVPGMGAERGDAKANQGVNFARRFIFTDGLKDSHIGVSIWYGGHLAKHWSNDKAAEATAKVLEQVRKDYSIDPGKIFILGFSCGSTFVLDFVWGDHYTKETFPFAGVIICSNASACKARGDYETTRALPKDLPIFLEAGSKEKDCVSASEDALAKLKKAGYTNCEFHIVKGQAHVISDKESGLEENATDLIASWVEKIAAKPKE